MDDYSRKRAHFIGKTIVYFDFLVNQFSFTDPTHHSTLFTNSNGKSFPITDTILYKRGDVAIELKNAYHPHDYGFEINILPQSTSSSSSKMIHHVVKEEQDVEQSYLEEAAEILKSHLTVL